MVKSKKMSKSSIAVIVLSLLLVLSMIMGMTGAWFTSYDKKSSPDVNFKFGNVTMSLAVRTVVSNDEDGDNEWFEVGEINNIEQDNGVYELIAGSRIKTGITITNTSTVDAYYVLKSTKLNGFYLVDQTNKKLIPAASGADLQLLAQNTGLTFDRMYQVAVAANGDQSANHVDQTADAAIFQVYVGNETEANFGTVAEKNPTEGAAIWENLAEAEGYYQHTAHDVLTYGDTVDLGALLVSGEFQLRAVQADNMTPAEAYTYLTTEANYTEA